MDRDNSIDILRALGMFGIILAHTISNQFLFQLRSFDVPLMVFISAYCFAMSKHKGLSWRYIVSRFKRLVLPVWYFFIPYYILTRHHNYFNSVTNLPHNHFFDNLFLLSPYYFWIIRVFLCMAILLPLISKMKVGKYLPILTILLTVINEYLAHIAGNYNGDGYWHCCLVMLIGYGIVSLLGYHCHAMSRRQMIAYGIASLTVFILAESLTMINTGSLELVNRHKYPPTLIYLSYAIGCCFMLISFKDKITDSLKWSRLEPFFTFVGKNTMWIYLLHIIFVDYFNPTYHPIKFIVCLLCPTLIVYLYQRVLNKIKGE